MPKIAALITNALRDHARRNPGGQSTSSRGGKDGSLDPVGMFEHVGVTHYREFFRRVRGAAPPPLRILAR